MIGPPHHLVWTPPYTALDYCSAHVPSVSPVLQDGPCLAHSPSSPWSDWHPVPAGLPSVEGLLTQFDLCTHNSASFPPLPAHCPPPPPPCGERSYLHWVPTPGNHKLSLCGDTILHSAQGTTLVSPPWGKGEGHPLHFSQATFHQILFSSVLGFDICTCLISYPDALFIHLSHHSSTTSSWTSTLLGLHVLAFGLICAERQRKRMGR